MDKSTATKRTIEQAFLNLLNQRPLSQVTIKDITATCGINRNTFYYHYKNIPDLIESVVKNIVDDIIAKYPPKVNSVEECFIAATSFAKENQQAIDHIYHSTNRAIFERHLWHICDYAVSAYLDSMPTNPKLHPTPEERKTLHDFLKFECFGFAIDWLNHGMPDNVADRVRTISSMLAPVKFTNI